MTLADARQTGVLFDDLSQALGTPDTSTKRDDSVSALEGTWATAVCPASCEVLPEAVIQELRTLLARILEADFLQEHRRNSAAMVTPDSSSPSVHPRAKVPRRPRSRPTADSQETSVSSAT